MTDELRDDDDSVEIVPVERRHAPRGTIPGLVAEVLEGDPLAGQTFEVDDVGLESFFLSGPPAAGCAPAQTLLVRLTLEDQTLECRVEVVRCEDDERTGAVLRLLPGQEEAIRFFQEILKPSVVPPGSH